MMKVTLITALFGVFTLGYYWWWYARTADSGAVPV